MIESLVIASFFDFKWMTKYQCFAPSFKTEVSLVLHCMLLFSNLFNWLSGAKEQEIYVSATTDRVVTIWSYFHRLHHVYLSPQTLPQQLLYLHLFSNHSWTSIFRKQKLSWKIHNRSSVEIYRADCDPVFSLVELVSLNKRLCQTFQQVTSETPVTSKSNQNWNYFTSQTSTSIEFVS